MSKLMSLSTTFLVIYATLASPAWAYSTVDGDQRKTNSQTPSGYEVYDNYGNRQGKVAGDGRMFDNYGNFQGVIKPDGTITDRYGNVKGKVKK